MSYRIYHLDCCCTDRTTIECATPHAVVTWLWGRDVSKHLIDHAACRYRFWTGNLHRVEAILSAGMLEETPDA
jgi:hypothetical protein